MNGNSPIIYIIAGEPSGDQMGAKIMERIRSINPNVKFYGIGGVNMQRMGMHSLFPMEELSIMGVWGILRDLPNLIARIGETVRDIENLKPDVLFTIDSPEFSFRIQKRVRGLRYSGLIEGVKLVHLVAPTVWAWRPGRAKRIAKFLDTLFCLYPFEPPLFEKWGLRSIFVGHPLAHVIRGDGAGFRTRHGFGKRDKLVALLPGSRKSEIKTLLPTFLEAAHRFNNHTKLDCHVANAPRNDAKFIIPTLGKNQALVDEIVGSYQYYAQLKDNCITVKSEAEFHDAIAAADAALAASGTVAMELALAETPMVIAYKLTKFPRFMMGLLIKTRWVSMVNILLNKSVVPELLQEDCNAKNCAAELENLLRNSNYKAQKAEISKIKNLLSCEGGELPEEKITNDLAF